MADTLSALRSANPTLNIQGVSHPSFARYGRVLEHMNAREMIRRARAILPSAAGVAYEPSVSALEAPSALNEAIARDVFGGMPIQVGWCYGHNLRLSALEYHKGAEVNVCLTDVLLFLGHVADIDWGAEIAYDTSRIAAFYAPEGAVLEFHAWNLHFAPCHVGAADGFATLVYLPRGTNEPLSSAPARQGEARLLFAVNKWLIAHPDAAGLVSQGAYPGLVGADRVARPV